MQVYGAGGTCNASGANCTLDPAAEQVYKDYFAKVGEGGHCYGLSVMTTLFYRDVFSASYFNTEAEKPYDLTRPNSLLDAWVSVYHAFQFDYDINRQIYESMNDGVSAV